ncbi:Nramp family divalent metal transporter [Saccharopolyspora sp. NPDC003752]
MPDLRRAGAARAGRLAGDRQGLAIPAATLLGAIAFAGAGGALNLVQSNWIRDKGLGMGSRLPKVVSPFTVEEQTVATTGYFGC